MDDSQPDSLEPLDGQQEMGHSLQVGEVSSPDEQDSQPEEQEQGELETDMGPLAKRRNTNSIGEQKRKTAYPVFVENGKADNIEPIRDKTQGSLSHSFFP